MRIAITLDDIQVRFLKNDLDMSPNDEYAISGSIIELCKERMTKSATYCDGCGNDPCTECMHPSWP